MSALVPRLTHYIPHVPHPKQQAALLLDQREGLYGGAAGGGKSDYLLMSALQYVDVPGYAAILFRKTFQHLKQPDGLLPRALEWLSGTDAVGAETDGGYPTRWDFPSGAVLRFGHWEHHARALEIYQGGAYDFVGFDEMTHFEEAAYRWMLSRLRRKEHSRVPPRVRAASNPGGAGHRWVRDRFITQTGLSERERKRPPFFMPSLVADNPSLDRDLYTETLKDGLLPYELAMLLHGDWFAQPPGALMERSWFHVIDEAPKLKREVRFWDCAGTKASEQVNQGPAWTAGIKGGSPQATNSPYTFVVTHVDRFRENPDGVKRRQLQRATMDGPRVGIRQEQEPGSAGKSVVWDMRRALQGYDFKGIPSTGSKIDRGRAFINAASEGEIAIVNGPWVEPLLRELEQVSIPPSGFMDQFDACTGAYNECTLARGVTWGDLYPEAAA